MYKPQCKDCACELRVYRNKSADALPFTIQCTNIKHKHPHGRWTQITLDTLMHWRTI